MIDLHSPLAISRDSGRDDFIGAYSVRELDPHVLSVVLDIDAGRISFDRAEAPVEKDSADMSDDRLPVAEDGEEKSSPGGDPSQRLSDRSPELREKAHGQSGSGSTS
jgi:hypothetical protein